MMINKLNIKRRTLVNQKTSTLKFIAKATRFLLVTAFLSIFAFSKSGNHDMGMIHATDAKVSEDSQKAIIFHNNSEEVLILGTDLKATKNTGVIRFIPFPSEPTVSLAPNASF